jgi:hypothetical protein
VTQEFHFTPVSVTGISNGFSSPSLLERRNDKQVIPSDACQLAVIRHDRKPGLIAWLRSIGKDQCSVRPYWHKRGQGLQKSGILLAY